MKHSAFMKAVTMMVLAFVGGVSAYSQSDISLRKIKAVKPGVEVNMLDSVVGENYRKIYQYNEYGYITSVMVYHKDTDWSLDTGASYLQDYTFNADGQCTERTQYRVDENGKRTVIEDQGKLEVKDGLTWEYTYSHNDDGKLHPEIAKAYDKWGNLTIYIEYETDWYDYEDYISSYEERRYSGPTLTEDHFMHNTFEDAYLVYHVKSMSSDATRTMDVNQLSVGTFFKKEWTQEGGKLYCRYYNDYDFRGTIGEISQQKFEPTQEYVYELNADGTRPVSKKEISSDSYSDRCYAYEWDAQNRLTCETESDTLGNVKHKYTYTYADDYAKSMSLIDAVYALEYNLMQYPEDEFCIFGRLATKCSEHSEYGDNSREENVYTWNANHQMVSDKWKETGTEYDYDYDNDTLMDKPYEDTGEVSYFYNAGGHIAYMIDAINHDGEDNEYYKEEFVYDASGNWTGEKEYSGDSFDGPWTDESYDYKARTRRGALKSASLFDDMSDGYHDIYNNDGVFETEGYYHVEDGKIVGGRYQQYIINTASIPENPEFNYTEPEVPFEIMDDCCDTAMRGYWYYVWNDESEKWECEWAPDHAERIHYNGDDIVCDTYNQDQQITNTTTYSFDEEGRFAKQSSENLEIVYNYLSDGSDYLLETITTQNGTSSVLHYYYSQHNYVHPASDIEEVKIKTGETIIYDLQGRRVNNLSSHGIYIVNGKKIMK